MRRPLHLHILTPDVGRAYVVEVVDVASAESRPVTQPVCVHADDVTGHPPTISMNALHSVSDNTGRRTVTVLETQARDVCCFRVVGARLPRSRRRNRILSGQCQLHFTTCSLSLLYTSVTTVHFDREETVRYVAVVRCTALTRPPPTTGWTAVNGDRSCSRRPYNALCSVDVPCARQRDDVAKTKLDISSLASLFVGVNLKASLSTVSSENWSVS